MTHIVKTLKNNVTLPNNIFYPLANSTADLTDEQFGEIAAADFTNGIVQDMGAVPSGLLSQFSGNSIGLVACTGDPATMPGSPGITTGRPYIHRVYVDQSVTATKMTMDLLSTGSDTVVSHAFMGVYNLGGTLLAQTADLAASFPASSTGAIINAALTAALTAQPINTEMYLAFLMAFTGTTPTVVGGRQFGTNQTMTADARLYTNTSGSALTALPSTLPALSQTTGFTQLFLGLAP